MRWARMWSLLIAVGLSLLATTALAQPTIFKWIDARGNLHATDRLSDVPEPYYGMYRAKLRALEEERAKQGNPQPARPAATPEPIVAPDAGSSETADAPPSIVDLELKRREGWKALVLQWRGALSAATGEVESIQAELDEATLNPILLETPAVKARVVEISARRDQAMERLEKARKTLQVIQRQARAQRWLVILVRRPSHHTAPPAASIG